MSAYLCSDKHLNTLINYAVLENILFNHGDDCHHVKIDPEGYAQVLYSENLKSLEARYGKDDNPTDFKFKKMATVKVRPVQIIKACHCYSYQACETEDYENSEAYALIKSIINHATHHLPGYDTAEWGIK